MKIAIASFTRNGCVWNQKLCAALKKHSCEGYALEKYGKEAGIPAIAPSLPAWTERMFQEMDAILFIGACGIAVRSIAPYVKSKKTDPAVLCMDEQGKFVISLLSGHNGWILQSFSGGGNKTGGTDPGRGGKTVDGNLHYHIGRGFAI